MESDQLRETGRISRALGRAIIWLRWPLLVGWVLVAIGAYAYLPGTGALPTSGIYALIPRHTAAFRALHEESRVFGSHLVPQIAVVQRDASHLGPVAQARIVGKAVQPGRGRLRGYPKGSLAVPLIDTVKLVPAARENSTTAVTYLAFPGSIATTKQRALAHHYARGVSQRGATARVTGLYAGTLAEASTISSSLTWVEFATLALIALVVGLYLKSLLAPVVTVFGAVLVYFVSSRIVTWVATSLNLSLHQEVEPIVVVLLVGVMTDYSVFFLSGMRERLLAGEGRREAARHTTSRFLPIIFTAGLLVTLSLATLQVASIGFVRALGPGMAIVIVITLLVALTFVPSAMGVLGKVMFWPGIRADETVRGAIGRELDGTTARERVAAFVSRPRRAAVTATVAACLLAGLGSGLFFTRIELTPIRGLPASSPAHRALTQAGRGFQPGVVSPTDVMLTGPEIASDRRKLLRLAILIRNQPGVAAAIGAGIPGMPHLFYAGSGNGARYLTVFDDSPFLAGAISALRRLQSAMPQLVSRAGLPRSTRLAYAGDTAIARDTRTKILHDLGLLAAAILAVDLILLAVFLRALVAPVYLVASSALSIAAAFGVTTYVFQDLFGYGGLTDFVPLAAGVLLAAFGSDYNLFIVGRIWQRSERRPTRVAIREAAPRASRSIAIAGLALAASFATLALVPLRSFRELAFAVAVGVLIDTFLVRSLFIPSLIALAGEWSWWPTRRSGDQIDHGMD